MKKPHSYSLIALTLSTLYFTGCITNDSSTDSLPGESIYSSESLSSSSHTDASISSSQHTAPNSHTAPLSSADRVESSEQISYSSDPTNYSCFIESSDSSEDTPISSSIVPHSSKVEESSNTHHQSSPSHSSEHTSSTILISSSSIIVPLSSTTMSSSHMLMSSSSITPIPPIRTTLKTYMFGHSLMNHESPYPEIRSKRTNIMLWMHKFAEQASLEFSFSGQYGFLGNHAQLPPRAQWGLEDYTGAWDDDDGRSFAEVNFNATLLTPANFVQYQAPYEHYYNGNQSPLDYTNTILNWADQQENNMALYVYENWGDMGRWAPNFDWDATPRTLPSESDVDAYHAYNLGSFHDWWIEYHDSLVVVNPKVKMIPVGPTLSKLLTVTPLSAIEVDDLYEDNSPHGKETIYFLAAMVTYMAMYGTHTPADFIVPGSIHPLVNNHYAETVAFIWNELNTFNFDDGSSRVFY